MLTNSETTIIHLVVLTSEAAAFAREETWTHEKSGVGDAVILYHHAQHPSLTGAGYKLLFPIVPSILETDLLLYSLKALTHFLT